MKTKEKPWGDTCLQEMERGRTAISEAETSPPWKMERTESIGSEDGEGAERTDCSVLQSLGWQGWCLAGEDMGLSNEEILIYQLTKQLPSKPLLHYHKELLLGEALPLTGCVTLGK